MSKLDYPKRSAALFKPAPADTPLATKPKVSGVNAGVNRGRKADRHSPAYMREYMRKKRAG
jgi:hypothetical protein